MRPKSLRSLWVKLVPLLKRGFVKRDSPRSATRAVGMECLRASVSALLAAMVVTGQDPGEVSVMH